MHLQNNQLQILPKNIGNLTALQYLFLQNNKLIKISKNLLKIKKAITIDETSYEINNMNTRNKILLFSSLKTRLDNIPTNTKEIWVRTFKTIDIKLPFDCVLLYY